MNLHHYLKIEFGRDCLRLVRQFEKTSLKLARFRNHLRYNLTCFNNHVIPKYLRLPTPEVKGFRAKNIIFKAERSLLNERIRQNNFTLDVLKGNYRQLESELRGILPEEAWVRVQEFVDKGKKAEHDLVKHCQIRKFRKLQSEKENEENVNKEGEKSRKDKWVVNISSRKLTTSEVSVLENSLNFAVSPDALPVNDIIVATESACKNLPDDKAAELKGRVVNIVKNSKPPRSNISKPERLAIESLKKDKSIQILPADKGRATMVIDNSDYESKALTLLQDENVYEKLNKDPTQKFQSKLIKLLKELKDKGAIDSKIYWKIYPTVADVPKFYGLIKIHKAGYPLRPIVSSIGAVTYELARFVAGIISPLVGQMEHHITNTQVFVEKIHDLKLDPDESIVSFDVSALFMSIPVKEALEVVKELLERDDTWKSGEAENLNTEDVIQLVDFCLSTTYFVFREKFYQQKDGCAMGIF